MPRQLSRPAERPAATQAVGAAACRAGIVTSAAQGPLGLISAAIEYWKVIGGVRPIAGLTATSLMHLQHQRREFSAEYVTGPSPLASADMVLLRPSGLSALCTRTPLSPKYARLVGPPRCRRCRRSHSCRETDPAKIIIFSQAYSSVVKLSYLFATIASNPRLSQTRLVAIAHRCALLAYDQIRSCRAQIPSATKDRRSGVSPQVVRVGPISIHSMKTVSGETRGASHAVQTQAA